MKTNKFQDIILGKVINVRCEHLLVSNKPSIKLQWNARSQHLLEYISQQLFNYKLSLWLDLSQ